MNVKGYIILGHDFCELSMSLERARELVRTEAERTGNPEDDYTITKVTLSISINDDDEGSSANNVIHLTTDPINCSTVAVNMWTDGACKGNPGSGGWGALIKIDGFKDDIEIYGGERHTTNNRMEILSVIKGLRKLTSICDDNPHLSISTVTIHTDSQYVKNGMTSWVSGWIKRGWKTAGGAPVKNEDLWKELYSLANGKGFVVNWKWVKGHNGNVNNERADELANRGVHCSN